MVEDAWFFEEYEAHDDAAIVEAAENIDMFSSQTKEEWTRHISKVTKPAIKQFLESLDLWGERHKIEKIGLQEILP